MRDLKAIGAVLFVLACMLATAALIGASWKAGAVL